VGSQSRRSAGGSLKVVILETKKGGGRDGGKAYDVHGKRGGTSYVSPKKRDTKTLIENITRRGKAHDKVKWRKPNISPRLSKKLEGKRIRTSDSPLNQSQLVADTTKNQCTVKGGRKSNRNFGGRSLQHAKKKAGGKISSPKRGSNQEHRTVECH